MSASLAAEDQGTSREKILDVAEQLFAARGFAGVGMRELADEAGLGKSSLFHHFHGKFGLYCEVVERALQHIGDHVAPALAFDGPVPEQLDLLVDALIDALASRPATARLMLRGLFEDVLLPHGSNDSPDAQAVDAKIDALIESFRVVIRRGVDSGELRNVSAAHTIQTVVGAIVYHFASGEFGEDIVGGPLFAPEAVEERRREVKNLLRHGLIA